MTDRAEQGAGRDLAQVCGELFAQCIEMQRGEDPGSAGELRQLLQQRLREVEQQARSLGAPPDLVEHCRFALVAFLDELVMTSRWSIRDEWAARPLALIVFDDLNAGENFYQRLDQLLRIHKPDGHALAALEVYATCLSLGFRGMHTDQAGGERIRDLLTQVVRQIAAQRGGGDQLSPHWEQRETLGRSVRRVPVWMVGAGVFAVLALLVLILEISLGGVIADAQRALEPR